ncbi:MAG: TonB-dependent receptor [Tannerellaceae bacterium]|jgi:iron complex outermembrane receptor protein|nr:TonB-dependent receptor [Tannerellaceae bacterium]
MKRKHFLQQQSFRFKKFARKGYASFNSMHKVVSIGVVAGCVLAAMTLSSAHAQESARAGSLYKTQERELGETLEQELDEVTVVAARPGMPPSQSAKLVTVITSRQIERAPIQSLQDVLSQAAHIDVIQRGGRGVQADISIRGGTQEQNVILLNGINFSNAHTGHYNLDLPLNVSDIERIEIIHGPSALIYGAGSFTGGINIITKKKAPALYARAEGGMHRMSAVELRGSAETGPAVHSLSASRESSDGYIANSDYHIYNVLWQTHADIPAATLDVQLGYNAKQYGANTFYSALYPAQYEQTSACAGSIKAETGVRLKVMPAVYWSRHRDRFELTRGSEAGRNFHLNDAYGANLVMAYAWPGAGSTRLGLDLRRESILSSVLGKEMATPRGHYLKSDARTNTGLSAEHTIVWRRWMASAGVLISHTTLLGKAFKPYPSLSLVYRPAADVKLSASWSKSTRMPTFTDLYYTTQTHRGDQGLRPEKSESLDISIKYGSLPADFHITGFLLWGRDMIDWVKINPQDSRWTSWNLTAVNTQGLEAGLDLRPSELLPSISKQTVLRIGYTRMHQSSDAGGLVSAYALNYLRDKFTVALSHPLPLGMSVDMHFRLQKRMGTYEKFEDKIKTGDVPYPGFSTLDLRLSYQRRSLRLYLNLNNIYNTYYFDRGNIPQPGFWLTGGISYAIR